MMKLRVKDGALKRAFRGYKTRLKNPAPVGREIAREMRFGSGGIAQQFAQGAEFPLKGGARRWKPARRDWTRPGERKGLYRDGWLGRSGASREVIHSGGVAVGINPSARPRMHRVFMLQKRTPTRIDMRRRRNGRKMQFKLGMLYGLWTKVVTIWPRPISINPRMLDSVGAVFTRYVATGR